MPASNEIFPVRYCFFMTGNEPWWRLAEKLHQDGTATPILWLGDDRHYERAKETFGNAVLRMLDFVHRPLDLPSVDYTGEYSEFFETEDYLDAKDVCLKMMDRLDLNGSFSRLDREAYFHKLLIWALKFFYENQPNAMLMIEKPHSHAQYLIYRVSLYLGIPAAHFKDCALMPVNFLQQEDGSFVKRPKNIDLELLNKFNNVVNNYVNKLSALRYSKSSFTPHYMLAQQSNAQFFSRLKKIFGKDLILILRDAVSDIRFLYLKKYKATNPYNLLFISRLFLKRRRQRNLRNAYSSSLDTLDHTNDYLYFPLHFEPERTTNPDGESYHDQFKVLILLRSFLPENIEIVVKEHPSQFYMADRGSRGRSPMFYQLIKNLRGVKFVGFDCDSFELIRNSIGVATITGSVALEASLLGKPAIVFGQAWYAGCPNVTAWSDVDNYDSFSRSANASSNDIRNFLINLVSDYGVPMINNGGQLAAYREEWYNDAFKSSELEGMKLVIGEFFLRSAGKGRQFNLGAREKL